MEKLEQESFGAVPEGIQHFKVEAAEEPVTLNDDGQPRLRITYRVGCGEFEDVSVSDFLGFYGSLQSKSNKSLESRHKSAKAMTLGTLAAIALGTGSGPAAEVVSKMAAVDNTDPDSFVTVYKLFNEFVEKVDGQELFCRVVKGKNGRAQYRYMKPDDGDATCTCNVEKISI